MNETMAQLVDGAVVLGLGVAAPIALGGWRRWLPVAAVATVALVLAPSGPAAVLAVPALVAAVLAVRAAPPLDGPALLAALWSVVATGALVCSCAGWSFLGQTEPFIRLTAVHFLFAGTGALTLAVRTGSPLAWRCTAAAPPLVALGFVTGWALPQVGGAVVLAIGVFATAGAELRSAVRPGPAARRTLLVVSGLAVWAPMVLAVAWAAGQHWAVPALSVPDMARWHGAPNAIGFVLCGLLAHRIPPRPAAAGPGSTRSGDRGTLAVR